MDKQTIVYEVKLQPAVIVLLGVIALVQVWNIGMFGSANDNDKRIEVRVDGYSMWGSYKHPIHIKEWKD